ncbi:hypothetical protein BaRGS_00011462 [Batillaria attramentaria]|uniref:Uncharacterized protein n=1 Tax=Batillaria attramentaria TaxID=370345 RepID=A0ABD0LCK8_9CAEN|nr:hypothetical protein BaRGS_004156 [Batillaria attramentaria]
MNVFKKSRSRSPSFEIPKLCLPRQKRSTSVDSSTVPMASLDVPLENNRMRSSSFDSSSLRDVNIDLLQVPINKVGGGHRSHSFDSATAWSPMSSDDNFSDKENSNSLKIPKYQKRRASYELPKICMHCVHLEALEHEREQNRQRSTLFYLGDSSPKEGSDDSSISDESDLESEEYDSSDSEGSKSCSEIAIIETLTSRSNTASPPRSSKDTSLSNSYTDVVTLAVPVMKPRSSSLDAGITRKPPESPRKASLDERTLHKAHQQQMRSQSVDVPAPPGKDQSQLNWLANLQLSFK